LQLLEQPAGITRRGAPQLHKLVEARVRLLAALGAKAKPVDQREDRRGARRLKGGFDLMRFVLPAT
jgi:hypothetical protein